MKTFALSVSLACVCLLASAMTRQDFRKAVAAGGAAAEKAVSDGLVSSDPAIRRAALWELYAKDPAAAFDRLDGMCSPLPRPQRTLPCTSEYGPCP